MGVPLPLSAMQVRVDLKDSFLGPPLSPLYMLSPLTMLFIPTTLGLLTKETTPLSQFPMAALSQTTLSQI